mmetsp:Transcript_29412/g.42676  ORF Transcript_29412/g.42676 Transcript_29412/m.42676 type:complete len:296 (+) Transcript_29412:99-986(+)
MPLPTSSEHSPEVTNSTPESQYKDTAKQQDEQSITKLAEIDASTTALIIIDVQPEYWSSSPYAPSEIFPHFPSSISSLIHICRNKRDFRKIIWIRADYQYKHKKSLFLAEFEKLHGPNHVYPSVDPNDSLSDLKWESFACPILTDDSRGKEIVIPKPSICATTSTGLVSILKELGVKTAIVAGLITSVCVHHSAFGLFESGLHTIVVEDACADREKSRHDMTLQLYGKYCYDVMSVSQIKLALHHDKIRKRIDYGKHIVTDSDGSDEYLIPRSAKKRKLVPLRNSGRPRTVSVSK